MCHLTDYSPMRRRCIPPATKPLPQTPAQPLRRHQKEPITMSDLIARLNFDSLHPHNTLNGEADVSNVVVPDTLLQTAVTKEDVESVGHSVILARIVIGWTKGTPIKFLLLPIRESQDLRNSWWILGHTRRLLCWREDRPKCTVMSGTDQWVWRLEINGYYSAKSAYAVMVGGGKIAWPFTSTWRYKVPPNVRIFTYLLLKNRLLTRKMMADRGFPCSPMCETCGLHKIESIMHLFFKCPKAIRLWNRMATIIGVRLMSGANTVVDTWNKSVVNAVNSGMGKNHWSVYFISTCWSIWKQRNKKIFEGKETPLKMIKECTLQEAKLWIQNC